MLTSPWPSPNVGGEELVFQFRGMQTGAGTNGAQAGN